DADRFSSLTGLSFNPLHREIFTPLALGATLCLPAPEDIAPQRLAEWMEREAITITNLTPPMIRVLCESAPGLRLQTLRYAFVAGDVLKQSEVRMLQQVAPNVTVVNFYGATETQRAVGYYVIPREEAAEAETLAEEELLKDSIPLGRGIE